MRHRHYYTTHYTLHTTLFLLSLSSVIALSLSTATRLSLVGWAIKRGSAQHSLSLLSLQKRRQLDSDSTRKALSFSLGEPCWGLGHSRKAKGYLQDLLLLFFLLSWRFWRRRVDDLWVGSSPFAGIELLCFGSALMHSRFGFELRMGFSRGVDARFRVLNLVESLGFDEMVGLRVGSRDLIPDNWVDNCN